jgi:ABC-type sugar transport system ATPase subunit
LAAGLLVEEVAKSFGSQQVLREISFSLGEGETGVIVGTSGVGKTTLLNVIAGTLRADAGRILIDGRLVESKGGEGNGGVHVKPTDRNVGYVFQDYLLFPHMSVFENVAYGLRAHHFPSPRVREEVTEVLDVIGLQDIRDKKPGQISGGQMQRVALARAIVLKPKLLLLDEPLSALDRQTRETLRTELRGIFDRLATTAVYVTHDLDEAFFFGEKIGILRSARLSSFGTRGELLRTMSSSTAEFLGFNLLKARFLRQDGPDYEFLATEWERRVLVRLSDRPSVRAGQDVVLAVSPDALRLAPVGGSALEGIRTRIDDVREFKDRVQMVLGDSEHRLVCEMSGLEFHERSLAKGDTVRVTIASASLVRDAG